ncbi:GGDEF domain-containing protein [Spirochaetia bacterium 38H-sp]|uniref:diguanylate cyclase n=1 Tax=Rarispira pelagica TaxID=3141764 RepID=A0ABU9UAL9_9SPIR
MKDKAFLSLLIIFFLLISETVAFYFTFPTGELSLSLKTLLHFFMFLVSMVWFLLLRREMFSLKYMILLFIGNVFLLTAMWGEFLASIIFIVDEYAMRILQIFYVFAILSITTGIVFLMRMYKKTIDDLSVQKERLLLLSITDDLTGLYNSRFFYERLSKETIRATRYDRCLSLLFLDLDNFKKFNDTYGHLAGDRVLRKIGRLIRESLRENDSGYRYGGEEFAILLPETCEEAAMAVAERLRLACSQLGVTVQDKTVFITVSIGVAEYKKDENLQDFLKRADRAMYRAKELGKNMAILAD